MARSHSTVLSINFLCALLCSVYGIDLGTNFFEQRQHPQVCQVYTLLESPVVIETFVPSNTILTHPACGCEITVTNAPTVLSTTVTITETLRQNSISTSSRNLRYSVITSKPNNLEIPTFHIIISDTTNQRRQSSSVYYLKGDGSITTNSSEAVQIYESDGRLYTIKGAPEGTYFANVNVESIAFASQPHSSLTPSSIAGSFDLGSTLRWQHEIFANSQAIFALTPEGIVKAIFNGKVPRGVKRVGLVLKRAGNYRSPVSSLSGTSTTGERTLEAGSTTSRKHSTTRRGPLNGVPSAQPTHTHIQSSSPTKETASAIPPIANDRRAFSNTKTVSSEKHTTTLHLKTRTKTSRPSSSTLTPSQPTCTTFSNISDGGLPITLGLATLASPPNWPFSYALHNTTFDVTFGLQTSPGSLAYAKLNPSTPPTDSILYYQLNPIHHTTTTSICESWGYLYHQQSGLCLTATVNSTTSTSSALFQGSNIALEPCMICDAKEEMPESNQLFCAVKEYGTLGKWFCMGFMGDDAQGLGYGVLYQEGQVDAVLEEGGGGCIYVAAL